MRADDPNLPYLRRIAERADLVMDRLKALSQ